MKITLKKVRANFAELVRPKAAVINGVESSQKYYSCSFLFSDDENLQRLTTAVNKASKDKWPTRVPNNVEKPPKQVEDYEKMVKAGIKETHFINASMTADPANPKKRPRTVQSIRGTIQDIDPSEIYSGCYVNAVLDVWADIRFGNKVNCALLGVQFVEDGPALGMGKAEDDDFEVLEDDDQADEFADLLGGDKEF